MKKLIISENENGCWARTPTEWVGVERDAFDEVAETFGHAEYHPGYTGTGYFFKDWSAAELSKEITAVARDEESNVTVSPVVLDWAKPTVRVTVLDMQSDYGMESTLEIEPIVSTPAIAAILGEFAADFRATTETHADGSISVAGLQGSNDLSVVQLLETLAAADAVVIFDEVNLVDRSKKKVS